MWIEPLANGKFKYIERYTDNFGKSRKVSVTLDKDTAQAKKQATVLLLEKIQAKQGESGTTSPLFWDLVERLEKIEKHSLKPATLRSRNTCKNYYKKLIPETARLEHLTVKFVNDLLEEIYYGKNLSKETLTAYKTYISLVFQYATKLGYEVKDPTQGLKFADKRKTFEEHQDQKLKYLELDEVHEVLELAEKRNHRFRLIIELLTLTGLRQGELFGLQYKNVSEGALEVTGTYDRIAKTKVTPKNPQSYRIVQLNQRAKAIIDEVIQGNAEWKLSQGRPDDFLILNDKTGNIIQDGNFSWFLRTLGYDKKRLTSHIFRHTHISLLTELGIPLKAIMDRVGHNQAKTTLQIYTHVTKKMSQSVIEKLDTLPL